MAHFYGSIQGNRGEATRMGSPASGFTTIAASYEGAVEVNLHHDKTRGVDMARVELRPWQGSGTRALIYEGPVGNMVTDDYFVELLSEDGDRLWSDVFNSDSHDFEDMIGLARDFALNELSADEIEGGSFTIRPVGPELSRYHAKDMADA